MRPPRPFKGNVIVWNLPDHFTGADVAALFDEHGLVLGATVKHWPDEPGRHPRGLVDLAPDAAVERAIVALDGSAVDGHALKVRRAQLAPRRDPPASAERPDTGADRAARPLDAWPRPHPGQPRRAPVVEYRSLTGRSPRSRP